MPISRRRMMQSAVAGAVLAAAPEGAISFSQTAEPSRLRQQLRRDAGYEGMFAVCETPWICILGVGSGGTSTEYWDHHEGFNLEETGMKTTGWARKGCMLDPSLPPGQLYNLETDRSETTNVYRDHPDVVERLTNILIEYRVHGRSRT